MGLSNVVRKWCPKTKVKHRSLKRGVIKFVKKSRINKFGNKVRKTNIKEPLQISALAGLEGLGKYEVWQIPDVIAKVAQMFGHFFVLKHYR